MLLREIPPMPRPLLTLEEAAQRLKTSKYSVRRWIDEGKLVGTKIGGQWKVDPDDLEDFIRRGKSIQRDEVQGE